ncbi:MAG: hypothetical protein LBR90_02950, partial [Elusimicrobiota bacterium]|nr:hypothetical protein [Elusimicrobiota bacterium]
KLLAENLEKFKDNFYKSAPVFDSVEKVLNVQLFDLLAAVKRAFERLEEAENADLLKIEEFPIEKKMDKIVALLTERPWVLLDDIFRGETKKRGVITCFMAALELLKIGMIYARQDAQEGEIRVYLNPDMKNADYKKLLLNPDQQPKEQQDGK